MKLLSIVVFLCFILTLVTGGCERTEKAVDLYKQTKEDARQKAQQAQEEARKIVDKKAKDALGQKNNVDDDDDDEKDRDDKEE